MPRFIYAHLNTNEYNFRLWKASAGEIVRNTKCANSNLQHEHHRHHGHRGY